MYCSPNCSAFHHATRLVNSSSSSVPMMPPYCDCTYPFSWNGSYCKLNCSKVPKSDDTVDHTTCVCQAGYSWNSTTYSCDLNCSTAEHSLMIHNGPNACYCLKGYTWTGSGCQLVCAVLPNTVVDVTWNSETMTMC